VWVRQAREGGAAFVMYFPIPTEAAVPAVPVSPAVPMEATAPPAVPANAAAPALVRRGAA